jgi:hypothetical protein
MAGLAAGGFTVGGDFDHPVPELSIVWILMATLTGQILEVIWNLRLRLIFVGEFVAIAARDG